MEESLQLSPEEESRYAELQLIALDFARTGDADSLAAMVTAGLPANLADEKGNTLLMLAAYHGHAETVRMLLARGADPERRNDRGQTPLAGVAFKGHLETAKALVEGGAAADGPSAGGQLPAQFAALFGHREMYEYLLSQSENRRSVRFLGIPAPLLLRVSGFLRRLFGRGGVK